jgi:Erv1 / Alr family
MGLPPDNWGPILWGAIHLVCLDARKRQIDPAAYSAFFESLGNVIPCKKCRDHLKENLSKVPPIAADTDMFEWSVNLHNVVNTMLKKPTVSQEEALQHWSDIANGKRSIHGKCKKKKKLKWVYILLAFILGLGLGWLLFKDGKVRRK